MSTWFLDCQIKGLESKMESIMSDWESLERSLVVDSELDDYNSMWRSLKRAQTIIAVEAARIKYKGQGDNENEK